MVCYWTFFKKSYPLTPEEKKLRKRQLKRSLILGLTFILSGFMVYHFAPQLTKINLTGKDLLRAIVSDLNFYLLLLKCHNIVEWF